MSNGDDPPSYRLLRPHFLSDQFVDSGVVVSEGGLIPVGWVPTLAVDPLNSGAVNAFYSAGPRQNCNENLSIYQMDNYANQGASPFIAPATYWKYQPSSNQWSLTGLGSTLPAVGGS
jgi:hypothetical protein